MRLSVHTSSVTQNGSYRDAISSSGATNCRNDTGQTIATRVTRNTGSVSRNSGSYMRENNEADFGDDDDDDDGFVQFVKKRLKRYYLGRFKPSITRQRIEKYVNKRGPWVRIWNSKRRGADSTFVTYDGRFESLIDHIIIPIEKLPYASRCEIK